jgi:hypothetical protein
MVLLDPSREHFYGFEGVFMGLFYGRCNSWIKIHAITILEIFFAGRFSHKNEAAFFWVRGRFYGIG